MELTAPLNKKLIKLGLFQIKNYTMKVPRMPLHLNLFVPNAPFLYTLKT